MKPYSIKTCKTQMERTQSRPSVLSRDFVLDWRYCIGFDRRGTFSVPSCGFGQTVIIFGVDMSSSVHVDNKKKKIF